jgi:hypothetical protein
LPSSEQPEQGCALRLQRGGNKTFYGSLIKTNAKPTVIPVEQLNAGWRHGAVVYNISEDFVNHLDKISDNYRATIAGDNESRSDSSESEEEEEEELSHVIQQEVLQSQRRRIIRDSAGQHITSYAQLSGQRQTCAKKKSRRNEMLNFESDEVSSAHKNSRV